MGIKKLVFSGKNKERDFLFDVNAGAMPGITQERKYGANSDIDPNTSPEIVRDGGGFLTEYPYLTANAQMYAVSDYAGCGATITVYGLKDDGTGLWLPHSSTVTVNGTTPVAIGEFIRVFRIRVDSCAANAIQGNIYVSELSGAVPTLQTQIHARVTVAEGSTLMAMYTIPSGYTGFIYRLFGSCGRSQDATFSWRIRPYGKVFRTVADVTLYESAKQFEVGYEPVEEKSDIVTMASTLTNNTQVRASFHFLLVDNDYL